MLPSTAESGARSGRGCSAIVGERLSTSRRDWGTMAGMANRWAPKVVRDGDSAVVRLSFLATARFPVDDVAAVEEIASTSASAGIGVHGWRRHWTINTRRHPAVRITFRRPARLRILGLPVRVRVLDLAPATADELRRELVDAR